jgi:hypothetical protein
MRITRQAAVTAVFCSLVACDAHEPTAIPRAVAANPGMQLTGELGAAVVQGQVSTPSGAGRRIVTVFAAQSASGQATGSYRVEFTATGLYWVTTVSCVSIDEKTAWVAGHITETNIPTLILGRVSYFYVTDNGKPHPVNEVPADVISTAKINDPLGEDVVFCTDHPRSLVTLNGLTGDIDIR